jgi:outer membrane protein assembly factor BamB
MVIDGTVVMGFWPFTPAFFGLSVIDGSTVWTLDEPEGEPIEGATGRGTALGPWSPVGPGVVSGDRVVFPAAGGWICLDPSSGQMWWRSTGAGRFRPGRPLPVDDGVIVVSPDLVSRLRLADGSPVWKAGFPPGGMALAPYRITPHVGTAGPGLIGDIAVVPGLDGAMHRLDVAEGADRGSLALGIRSAAAPLIIDDVVVLLGVDGSLAAFARDEVVA